MVNPTIPPQAVAFARTSLNGLLTDTCTVTRTPNATRSASGATKPGTPSDVATGVPCRVELIAQTPQDAAALTEMERYQEATHNVFLEYDAPVQEGDRLTIDGAAAGTTALIVIGLSDRQTQPFLLQAIAKERS